jgi:hypothetical protein
MIYPNKLLPLIVSPLVLTLLLVTIGTLTRRRWITFSGAPSGVRTSPAITATLATTKPINILSISLAGGG